MKRTEIKRTAFKRAPRADWPEEMLRAATFPLTPTRRRMKQAAHRLNRKVPGNLQVWARAVKERDGWFCQWMPCEFCHNIISPRLVTAHHKALRSARPDLRLELDNGVTVCWPRHAWIHSEAGRQEAIEAGFLNLETYEAAARVSRGGNE